MTVRWYVWPVQTYTYDGHPYRTVKYLLTRPNPAGIFIEHWGALRYGLMDTALVWADVTPAQQAMAEAQADIVAIPELIDLPIGSAPALAQVQTQLEALHIPADWVTVDNTYREVMRIAAQLFLFAQRYEGRQAGQLIQAGYNLDTTINDLPPNVKLSLNDTAQSLGYDTTQILLTWTVRHALKYLADQWGDRPILIGGLAL